MAATTPWSASRSTQPVSSSDGSKARWRCSHALTMRTSSATTTPGSSDMRRLRWESLPAVTALSLRAPPTSVLRAKSRGSASTSSASPTTWRTMHRLRSCQALLNGPPPSRDPPVPNVADTSQVMKRTMMMRRKMFLVPLFCKCLFFFFKTNRTFPRSKRLIRHFLSFWF